MLLLFCNLLKYFINFSGQLIGVQTQETEEQKSSTPLLANINQSIVSCCYI